MIVLDASVWMSALLAQDIHHTISLQWSTQWITEGRVIVVPALFLAEVDSPVARPVRQPALGRRAVADAVDVALPKRLAVPLFTWDNEQLRRAATVIVVRVPPA
jgi:predicted nucleic acid-binding protein